MLIKARRDGELGVFGGSKKQKTPRSDARRGEKSIGVRAESFPRGGRRVAVAAGQKYRVPKKPCW